MWGSGSDDRPAADDQQPTSPPPVSGEPTTTAPTTYPGPAQPPAPPTGGPSYYPGYPPAEGYPPLQAYPPSRAQPPSQVYPPVQAAPYPTHQPAAPYAPTQYAPTQYAPSPYAPNPYAQGPYGPPRRADEGLPMPVAVRPVPQTPYLVAIVGVPPTMSGRAVASLVAGVGSILVSSVVACFGVLGGQDGWGPAVAGAFVVLALFAGIASVVLGRMALGEHRRPFVPERPRGRGIALAGVICGASGLVLTALAFLLAVALAYAG